MKNSIFILVVCVHLVNGYCVSHNQISEILLKLDNFEKRVIQLEEKVKKGQEDNELLHDYIDRKIENKEIKHLLILKS